MCDFLAAQDALCQLCHASKDTLLAHVNSRQGRVDVFLEEYFGQFAIWFHRAIISNEKLPWHIDRTFDMTFAGTISVKDSFWSRIHDLVI